MIDMYSSEVTKRLYLLVFQFRHAMDFSFQMGEFEKNIRFQTFPRGCCGDTCYLLAEYLRSNGYETIYVCGRCRDQSHAWLVLKDDRVKMPQEQFNTIPEEIKTVLHQYGGDIQQDERVDISHYAAGDVENGTVIDITGDQFGESAIYVGEIDSFHKKFEFDFAHDMNDLRDARLIPLYRRILQRI